MAPSLKDFAKSLKDHHEDGTWHLQSLQIVLCAICAVVSLGHSSLLSHQQPTSSPASAGTREEARPLKSTSAEDNSQEPQRPSSAAAARPRSTASKTPGATPTE